MKIPSLPLSKIVNDDDQLHSNWQQYFTQLTTQLQKNMSDEGYVLPMQSNDNVTTLNTDQSIGALIYDTDEAKGKINNDGTYKAIAVEPIFLTNAELMALPAEKIEKQFFYAVDNDKLYIGILGVLREVAIV